MARITVEDCLENVENRFELVMVSSKRARQIQTGGKDPLVNEDNDKPTVIALREIADNLVNADILKEKPKVDLEELEEGMESALNEVGQSGEEGEASESTEALESPASPAAEEGEAAA